MIPLKKTLRTRLVPAMSTVPAALTRQTVPAALTRLTGR